MENRIWQKAYLQKAYKSISSFVRALILPILASTLLLIGYKIAIGTINIWLSCLLPVWLTMGFLLLSPQPPLSMRHAVHLLPRSFVWPWYFVRDSSISQTEKIEKLFVHIIVTLFYAGLIFIWTAPTASALPESVREFISVMNIGGIIAAALFMLWQILRSEISPFEVGKMFVLRIYLLYLGIAFISHSASTSGIESLLLLIQTNPGDAVIFIVAMYFVALLFNIVPSLPERYGTVPAIAASLAKRLPTEIDYRITAAHEAGHALMYVTLDHLPDGVEVVVPDEFSWDGALGYVSSIKCEQAFESKTFSEFKMLVFLGGQIAEEILLGEASCSSSSDMTKWQNEARHYLTNGLGFIYFNTPENQFEAAQNQATLDSLRDSQRLLLTNFYRTNKPVMEDLAATLIEKRKLNKEDLTSLLSRVQVIEGLPKLKL